MATVAEFRATHSMVQPMALPTYGLLAAGMLASLALVVTQGFRIAPSVLPIYALWPFVALSGMLLRRVGHPRAATLMEATALIYGQGLAFLLAMFPLTALSASLADARLAAADAALGFDWIAYARLVEPVINPLVIAYKSFNWQPLLIVVLLTSYRLDHRLWRFVFASTLALAITTAIYPFAPAVGAFTFHHLANYSLHGDGPRAFGPVIEQIKAGDHVIRPSLFTGFVSMPSYHAAAAVLLAWASWPLRYWRGPLVGLNLAMLAAAPIVGGHYLVDIIAGLAVGIITIAVCTLTPRDHDDTLAACSAWAG